MLFNARGLTGKTVSKEAVIKCFMTHNDICFAGIVESQTYRDHHLSDERWMWDAGVERRPSKEDTHPAGGIGMFIDNKLSLVFYGLGRL
jgi:hypothetical protein